MGRYAMEPENSAKCELNFDQLGGCCVILDLALSMQGPGNGPEGSL